MKNILILTFLLSFFSFGQNVFGFNKTTVYVEDTLYKETYNYNSFEIDLVNNRVSHTNFDNEVETFKIVKAIFEENNTTTLLLIHENKIRYVLSISKYFILMFENVVIIFE